MQGAQPGKMKGWQLDKVEEYKQNCSGLELDLVKRLEGLAEEFPHVAWLQGPVKVSTPMGFAFIVAGQWNAVAAYGPGTLEANFDVAGSGAPPALNATAQQYRSDITSLIKSGNPGQWNRLRLTTMAELELLCSSVRRLLVAAHAKVNDG